MKCIVLGIILSLLTSSSAEDHINVCSTVNPNRRVDCGYFGIASEECVGKGCCWNDSVPNVPYCFNKPNTSAPDYKVCSLRDPEQRMSCGVFIINKTECNGLGCCYDNTVSGVPWCFNKPDVDSPDYEICSSRDPKLRVDCGTFGTNKSHCLDKGCCYDNSVGNGVAWCFRKPNMSEICASISHIRRVECGWFGVTQQECQEKNCCYDDSTKGAKYCFNKPNTTSPDYASCSKIDPTQRVDCGWYGITRDQCQERGCCYDNTLSGFAWCFNKPDESLPASCSKIDPKQRVDCGWYGITRDQCQERGCCYDNTLSGFAWCFNKPDESLPEDCSAVAPADRKDCGYMGISKEECADKECCYDNSLSGSPWCFHRATPVEQEA